MSPTAYDLIEDGMLELLLGAGTPFKAAAVQTFGCQLSDAEVGREIQKMASIAPACMIFYAGGEVDDGLGSEPGEQAIFTVVYVASAVSRDTAGRGRGDRPGVYQLLKWGQSVLHNARVDAKILNPLTWRRNRRFALPHELLTVAAYAQDFTTLVLQT